MAQSKKGLIGLIPVGLFFALIIWVVVLYFEDREEVNQMTISSLYPRAEKMIKQYDFAEAINTYSDIISRDKSQEKAWYEKGKLLNQRNMCEESILHYNLYIKEFPTSLMAREGYAIAKECVK